MTKKQMIIDFVPLLVLFLGATLLLVMRVGYPIETISYNEDTRYTTFLMTWNEIPYVTEPIVLFVYGVCGLLFYFQIQDYRVKSTSQYDVYCDVEEKE